ncbi:MAG: hypothetical protein CL790_06955 [Chloroflexi bacterium]|nr:hypothetical protein [Chloroflexota bacterium]HCU72450.1 hypothetical protein [Chloroflexota bacterium]|tara:strand:+ start:2981 stop:3709 length:729 start_codon:yes stop_codon:yes gene_type:complete
MEKVEVERGDAPSPEVRWVKTSGSDALQTLDRHWIRYVRITLLFAAVVITWRILAWQDDGYREAAVNAGAVQLAERGPVGEIPMGSSSGEQKDSVQPITVAVATAPSVVATMPAVTPVPTKVETLTSTPTPAPKPLIHRVKPGDTVSGISQFYDVSVKVILELNGISNVDNIFVGQELRLPPDARMPAAAEVPPTYRVQSGDTLSAIAVKFGVSIEELLSVNGLKDADSIFEGQEIRLSSRT